MIKGMKLGLLIAICEAVGVTGGVITAKSIPHWYKKLKKPSFSPPSWVFGPVWTMLYALMGLSTFIITEKKAAGQHVAISAFAVQLLFNFLWTFIFFGKRSPFAAFIDILFLWVAIVATVIFYWCISRKAALLLIPYFLWVTFASVLNLQIWKLNRQE